MAHHIGDARTSLDWSRQCNDLIHRVCELFPQNFVGVCQLPQTPSDPLANCISELERLRQRASGFIGCNLNPDPSGGRWNAPPLIDRDWYPVLRESWWSWTCRRWCTSARRATRTSTPPARTTSMPTRRRSCSS
jgi:4-oxalmesaconate hydratase